MHIWIDLSWKAFFFYLTLQTTMAELIHDTKFKRRLNPEVSDIR